MPKPKKGEKKEDFISRCIPQLIGEGREKDQASAICYSMWDNKDKEESKSKYTTEISGSIRATNSEELEKLGISKASLISQANTLIPSSFDMEKNMDVLPVVFNLAVVNKFNANDDGISTKTAASIVKNFINKPINIEHMKEQIVGHIINASFSDKQPDFHENDLMDFIDRKDPFFITAAGVIYKHIYPDLADALIRASKEEDEWYGAYSTSWEIGFNEFDIAVGSEMLMECEIIENESEEYEETKGKLRCFGGSGGSDKGRVYRLIKGEALPFGAALTMDPAADVKGVFPLSSTFSKEKGEKESYSNKNISKKQNNDVTNKNSTNFFNDMTDEQSQKLIDLLEKATQSEGKELKEAVASLKDFADVIKENGTEWKSKAEKAEEALSEAKKELEDVRKEQADTAKQLKSLKADMEVKAAAQLFNDRIASVKERFELSEAQEKIVVEDIKDLASEDEAFEKFMAKAAVLFADCDKETKAEREEAKKAAIEAEAKRLESKASKGEEKEEKKDGGELEIEDESKASVTNNNGNDAENETFIQRLMREGLQLEK